MFAQMSTHMSIEFAGVTAHGSPSRGHSKYPVVTGDFVISVTLILQTGWPCGTRMSAHMSCTHVRMHL